MGKITIFLDIDGTLSNIGDVNNDFKLFNLSRGRIINGYFNVEHRRERYLNWMSMVSKYNIEEFHYLCNVLGYDNIDKIVITSTWRYELDLKRIARVLYLKGLDYELVKKITDMTDILKREEVVESGEFTKTLRTLEIEKYIKDHSLLPDRCIVLDDMELGNELGEMYYDFCDYVKGFEYNGIRLNWKLPK